MALCRFCELEDPSPRVGWFVPVRFGFGTKIGKLVNLWIVHLSWLVVVLVVVNPWWIVGFRCPGYQSSLAVRFLWLR